MKTNTAKHTPGPWEASNANGVYANRLMPASAMQREHYSKILIADEGADALSKEERTANARLIAAAPELLALLEHLEDCARLVIERWESGDLADAVNSLRVDAANARAAIAKAKGGAA